MSGMMNGMKHCVGRRGGMRRMFLLLLVVLLAPTRVGGQEEKKSADEPKSSQAALTAYSDAATYQNKMAYELAADEWARFLERFGDDPLAAKARHYRGVCLIQLKEYAEAAKILGAVVSEYPDFELLEETYLNLGWSQYCLGENGDEQAYAEAAETFGKLEAALPTGKYADQALFFRAESLYALDKKKDAAMAYGKLVTGHEDSKLRPDALYALGVTLEELGEWKKAKKSYDMYMEDYAEEELATEVRLRLAESILQDGDPEAAAKLFGELAEITDFAAADHALMRHAYCKAQQGHDAEAAKRYEALLDRFPESEHVAEAKMSAARCYYRAQQYAKAARWFDDVLSSGGGPGKIEAAHWRCRIHLTQEQPEQALKLAEQTLEGAGDDAFVPKLRLDKADALYELADRKPEAFKEYVAITEAYPKHEIVPVALYNAAFAALELEDYNQATELAGQFLASHPEHPLNPDTRYIIAECKVQENAYEEAEAIYRRIIESAEDHPERSAWRVRLGLVLYLRDKWQEVIDLLAPLTDKMQPPVAKAEALYLIGLSQFRLEDHEAAVKSFRDSVLADARWRNADEALLYLARAQRRQDQLSDAIASLEDLLKTFPDSTLRDQAHYRLGETYYAAKQYADAVTAYDKVLTEFKNSSYRPAALYGKGWSRMKAGQFEPAATTFTTFMEEYPDHELASEALLARGICYRQAKKYEESIADLTKYLDQKDGSSQPADALYELGLSQSLAEQFEKAANTFSELLAQHPDYGDADKVYYELAWAHKSLSNEKAAAEAFATLAESHGDSPLAMEARFHMGEKAYADEKYQQAIEAYQQAIDANDSTLREKALYKLGWSHYQLEQYEKALARFEDVLESHGDSELAADAWFMKGECLFKSKDFESALTAYENAMRQDASSPQIDVLRQLHAAQAAGQLEQWKESIGFLDPLISNHGDNYYVAEAHFERGQARLKLKQPEDAIEDFRLAAEKSRGLVGIRALFMAGEVEFQEERHKDAIKDFQRAMFRGAPEDASDAWRNWQAKAGYEAGRCSEVQLSDAESSADREKHLADAKKFYQYVLQSHPEHELAAEAKKRLADLAELTP
ncbi:MAG: tetratricopeptide repeat protein [Pirellulaceae bacterium]